MNGIPSGSRETDVTVTPTFTRRVSWGAIWAGMFVTIIMEFMFILLGIACGISSLNPNSSTAATQGMTLGAMIWLLCSWLVAVWGGARVAGWMCGGPRRADGTVHGIVVWSFSAAVILLLLTGAVGIGGAGAQGGTSNLSGNMLYNGNNNVAMGQQQPAAPSGQNQSATGGTGGEYSSGGGAGTGGTGNANNANAANPPTGPNPANWGKALWTFIALVLGLLVAGWGGAMGASALERIRVVRTTA